MAQSYTLFELNALSDDELNKAAEELGTKGRLPKISRQEMCIRDSAVTVQEGLQKTVCWYLNNQEWLQYTTSGDYQKYYTEQYQNR